MLVREKKILFVLSSISITWQQAVPMVYELMYYAYIRPMKNFNIPFFFLVFLYFMAGTVHLPILTIFLLKCINKKKENFLFMEVSS